MTEQHRSASLFDLVTLKELHGYKAGDLLAVDAEIYPKLMKHLSRTVKHDKPTKNMVVLTGLSVFTSEPINLFLRGESSIGKTYNVTEALKYFPKKNVWFLGGLSPTALVHDKGKLVDEHGEEIDLTKKPEKPHKSDYGDKASYAEASRDYKEQQEIWVKRLKNSHYLVELSGKVLVFLEAPHIETFNKLRPVLSHDTLQISYKFTDKNAKGKLQTQHVVIEGFPATIFCSTDEKYIQDLATRSFTLTPETTQEKYKKANVLTGDKAAFPWKFQKDRDFMLLEAYVRFLRENFGEIKVIIPYAHAFAEAFPTRFSRSMRDFKHILSLIKVFALFHFAQRPVLVAKAEGLAEQFVMSSKQDFDFVTGLWNEIRETTETSAPGQIMKFYHEVVEKLAARKIEFLIQDLVEEWNNRFEEKKSSSAIRKWVDFLCDIGYMTKNPNPLDKRSNVLSVIRQKNGNSVGFNLAEFFGLESFRAWLNDVNQILEKSEVILKQNFMANDEASSEGVFKKFYLCETEKISNIALSPSQPSLAERTEEKTNFLKPTQFPNFNIENVLKLERLGSGFHDKCVICGFQGSMDYQATFQNGSWGLLCGSCGIKIAQKIGEFE